MKVKLATFALFVQGIHFIAATILLDTANGVALCLELLLQLFNRLTHPEAANDLLMYRLNRLLAVAGSLVVRLCEGGYGITRREWGC